ncbi:MAG: tRNA (adenosine(37)-N6)-dimethylallyltransferase MiaA [Acidimicrobiales bacterium]|nr:tRNA (adenosine(37)-N6)-dimethylallyltransferase MiaA [Acidimicrobiales bacterium]
MAPVTGAPIVIVGPTGSGKSNLGVQLAVRLGACQIISADAMSVYRGMDVGTAKPTEAERAGVTHHLIDVVDPTEEFDVAQFQHHVADALAQVESSGERAVLVGGTGLYVRAVVDDFDTPPKFPDLAAELSAEPDTAMLHSRLAELDPLAATRMEPGNRRRVLRALEVTLGSGRPFSSFGPGVDAYPPTRFVQLGLEIDRSSLDARINARFDQQMERGFLDEVALLPRPLSRTASQALGYRELLRHLDDGAPLAEQVEEAKKRTRRFARRQQRWFRRDPRIRWLDALSPTLIDDALTALAEADRSDSDANQ